MTPREHDLLKLYNPYNDFNNAAQKDFLNIARGAQSSLINYYGDYLSPVEDHWYEPISSLMQSSHKTSISSLNDDNRNDEKEIELLEEASKITDDHLARYKDSEEFYTQKHLEALKNGDKKLAEYYRLQAIDSKTLYDNAVSIRKQADELVNKDKNLFTLSGHNPILEAIGEIASYSTEGLSVGGVAGGAFGGPAGAGAGAIIGLIGGALYGGYDYIAKDKHKIDRSSYAKPLSEDRNENYANAIKTRQSYKNVRSGQIQDEQEDLLWWQTNAPVSDYYRYIEASGTGNYAYYNLPGIIGSSFSDTKHMGQQMVGSYGMAKIANMLPKGKWAMRSLAFANALKAGWQASLNENHAEASDTATKKVLNELKKNKDLSDEMLSNAKQTAVELYGLTEYEADKLIDPEIAFTMYQAGMGGLDPRNLKHGYQYYKAARKLGDNGADTQFERDMMATAGGDVLEAALMVTPYGALAKKSKMLGRAIAGAAVGAAAGEFAGFGVPGSIIGGAGGAVMAQVPFARRLWNKTFKTVQQIEDNILPKLEHQIVLDKVMHGVGAFGATALAEAAEEGTQYLNSLDAEKILTKADDDLSLRNMKNLFVNDLKKRGEVFNAVLSQIGLTDSPYQNDQEFWSNWKGGLILGGLMTGATVSLQEAAGMKKAYQTARYLRNEVLSTAVANRTEAQDAILKGVAFAKYGQRGNKDLILEVIDRAKKKNQMRENSPYSDEDFDKLSEQANRIISTGQYGPVKERLNRLGYDPESEEAHYALSVFDYYTQKTRQNRKEGLQNWATITGLMSSQDLEQYLDNIVSPQTLNDGVDDTESEFTFNVKQEDGTIKQQSISNRERLKRLHQNAAQLIAITQLLKDLQDTNNLIEYAKTKGIAFNNKQSERSIASLKQTRDRLKNAVEIYSKTQYDTSNASYDQQIDYLKTMLIPVDSAEKLVDAYRDSALLMLNQEVYSNIVKSIGLGGEANVDVDEASKMSHKIVNMFKNNVIKNQQLQEIIDYVVQNDNLGNNQAPENGSSTATPDIEDPGFEDMSQDDIASYLTSGGIGIDTALKYAQDKANEYYDDAEYQSGKLFGRKKAESSRAQAEKWNAVRQMIGGTPVEESNTEDVQEQAPEVNQDNQETITPESEQTEGAPIIDGNTITWNFAPQQQAPVEVQSEEEENSPTPEPVEEYPATIDEEQSPIDESPIEVDDRIDDAPLPDQPGVDSAPVDDDSASAIITEEGDGSVDNVDLQQQAIDNLTLSSNGELFGPTKLIDGWYLSQDGSIIPSERMYMANPVETKPGILDKFGVLISDKYLRKAAEIRLRVYQILKSNVKAEDKLLKAKLLVSEIVGTADISIVDPIANAILKNDQNAVKLLIIQANPRTWQSYYVNEYFRDAFRKILTNQVVNRPEYIDEDQFKRFCENAIRYKRIMEQRYGWKFVTNYSPSFTEVDGQKVVADPDFLAVDKAGNIHVVNVHTMKNDDYVRWGGQPIKMTNTKNTFSIMEERAAYVDLQIKALQSKPGVVISSAVLLPTVVDKYENVHRLYIGEMIPVEPSEQAVKKYSSNEDQMDELKALLKVYNEKAEAWTKEINDYIEQLKAYRKKYHTKGYRFRQTFTFTPEAEPTSVAEAYAQLDKIQQYVQRMSNYKTSHMDKEIAEMQRKEAEDANTNKKSDVSKDIDKINAIKDESWTSGIEVELEDADSIKDKDDLLTNGIVKVYLKTTPNGVSYIVRELEYKGKTYKISIKRNPVAYGAKNGGRAQTNHPIYTNKIKMIEDLLRQHPDLVVTIDLRRSYTTYDKKPSGHKPIELNSSESIITQKDIDNLGVQQDDGKIVDIGFYDKKLGVIQSGAKSADAVLGRAPEGDYWQNQLFLVIKQNHAENELAERRVAIPLIRSKFNKNIANFVAKCFKIIADTNHTAEVDWQKKRDTAIQMLHFFIGQRLSYKEGDQELPNIVYTVSDRNTTFGDVVRLNQKNYNLHNLDDVKEFTKDLQNCEIMPRWDTFNVKFKNLAQGSFPGLYEHFSTSNEDFHIAIDGVDSGLVITKQMFDNDTLCQWTVKNGFLSTNWFVKTETNFTMHNLTISSQTEAEVKEDLKQPAEPVKEAEAAVEEKVEEERVMTEEELKKWMEENGAVEVEDEDIDDEEFDSYEQSTPSEDYIYLRNVTNLNEALKLVSKRYRNLSRILRKASEKIGVTNINVVVLRQRGPKKIINGVERQKKGTAKRNADGSWTITIYSNAKIKTLAHELVHVFTLGAIEKNTQYTKAAKVFYAYCKEVFTKDELKQYGFTNFKEFVAEFFTNQELINILLSKGPIDENVAKTIYEIADIKPRNFWQSTVAFISKLWHKYILRDYNTSYRQIYDVMQALLKDSYEYKGADTFNDESISLYDIMSGVVKDIKEKLTKKGYTHKNPISRNSVHFENATSAQDLREAVDGIMPMWFEHDNVSPIGASIDKVKFSVADVERRLAEDADFAEWWRYSLEESDIAIVREIAKTRHPYKEGDKNATYEREVIESVTVGGKKRRFKVKKTFYRVKLENWEAITPIIDEYMSDTRIDVRRKVEERNADEEMEQREEGLNTFGELLTESYEISPYEKASREVKFLFSTVPYPDGSHNKFGMRTFMPFRDVYGKVLYYTANCNSTQEILNKMLYLSKTGPDAEMFGYLYTKISGLINNRWRDPKDVKRNKSINITNKEGKVFDANADSVVIKVIRALRQQQNNFIWATAKDVVDKEGNKSKDITIRTTLYEKGATISVRNWIDQLSTGLSGVLKYDAKTASYKFQNPKQGNVFKKIYFDLFEGKESFLYAYDRLRQQNPEDVTVHWRYLPEPVKFSQLTDNDVKTYLHNALLECGVDVRPEVIDLWLAQIMENNKTVKTPMDALYVMLSDRNSTFMPINFFMRLATDEDITIDVLQSAFNSGFIKELANMQNEYNLKTQSLMTTASHNNQYYIVSESNYINDLSQVINKADENDQYIQMLKEDSFAQGSVVAEMINDGTAVNLQVSTFVGMKTNNIGDNGRDYFEIELGEDIISKFELLHEGYMLSPTQSDKKTYHTLRGIPIVGMLIGKRTNLDCYDADLRFNSISIRDKKILDRFIKYFESEKNAVEKAIVAYENDFYKNNPGKNIKNYSDGNGMYFSSFNCIPLADGTKIYLNRKEEGKTPRDLLNEAYQYFFGENVSTEQRREIVARMLLQRAQEDINKAEEVGLIKKNEDGLYENIGLDGATIIEIATRIGKARHGENFKLGNAKNESTGKYETSNYSKQLISAAIQEYIIDCSIKHMQSMQEYQRLFSGSKSFYKWNDNGKYITDISVDYTKRRGGDISTGGVNVTDIDPLEGMEELGTYRCIEVKDYEVESNTLQQKALEEQFLLSDIASAAAVIKSGKKSSQLDLTNRRLPRTTDLYNDREEAERIIREAYGEEFLDVLKSKAKADAAQYFKKNPDDKAPVNVADGATYISDSLCEKLLREEGKWDDKMKYAFEVLRGKHGADVLSEQGAALYKSILDVIIGTQKYTATGFRKSPDGSGGTLMTPYYNKTALFPIFDQIAYGKIAQLRDAMRRNGVDMIMMTSAVKVGSQGAISIDQLLDGTRYDDHTYVQEMRFLRKQLNTDPNEREEMNLGTQTIKIALANLRMNDDYIDPFTGKTVKGKDLYKKIMRSYNILTDLGFEQVMRRFSKKDFMGSAAWQNILNGDAHFSLPEIDEEALSRFLYEELQSRDANDNMFEAIRHDEETDRLAAPLSAISQSGWIDSILASYINKTIIDTKSPGSAYIQRSIFCMEGEGDKTLYGGKELKLVNDDGSMDAVISIDFFEKIIPGYENMTFEQARQWLIDHKLIGDKAKTYTISYRIPTQAQSSINPLKFVDVVPVIRDSIILPKEFTKLTGSDFDIDKLFLSRLFINPDTIENPDQMFTFLDDPNASEDKKIELLRKGYTNNLFKQYITLLMDKQSAKTKWRPIDADTELWEDVYKDLYPNSQQPIESMSQDTIAYQTEQKNNFVVGKIGIGPFALNNNNHIYTMLYGISLGGPESLLRSLGKDNLDMGTLYGDRDIYGNSILSWLSGGINAHVDIAKDPFVTKLNVNKYTYNITNFLLRAGFGRNGLWFLNLPVIKELARQMNGISGQYLKQSSKSEFEAQEELLKKYKQKLIDTIPQNIKDAQIPGENSVLSEIEGVIGRTLTIGDIIYNRDEVIKSIAYSKLAREYKGSLIRKFKDYCEQTVEKAFLNDMVETDKDKSILYRTVKGGNTKSVIKSGDKVLMIDENIYNYIAILVFESINKNEAKTTSDLTKFAKIDTKKQGSTVAAQIDFLSRYEQFVSEQFDESAKVHGDVSGFFGLLSDTDILGFDTSLMLNRPESDQLAIGSEVSEGGLDITEAGYAPRYNNSPVASFIDNKTKKAINALIAIIRNDSIEGTYGFNLIWNRVKSDFGKTSLTEDAQKKLRAAILGATKHAWAMSAMKKLGINPVGLFRDENDSMSLAHELVKLKTKRVSYEGHDGRKTFGTVAQKYKDNALLNMLFDGHTKDEHTQTDKLIEILDFIKVHVPFTDDSKKSNVYIRAWRDLYNDPVTKDFAVKLMFYSLLTSNDSGGNNIFKYVPFEMLKDYGLFDAERELIRQLGDPSVQFAKNNSEYLKLADELIKDIVDRVESILVEDFEFSTPFAIETKKYTQDRLSGQTVSYNRKEYTGFGSKFGNDIVKNGQTEETDRIPYVFIPIRISSSGYVSPSETMSKSTKNGTVFTNNQYIRVLNPVANYENSQKYLTYKKIGEIVLPIKDKSVPVPIYQLVDSCMYKLGQYKVYNYNNEMKISSSQTVATMKKYTLTSPYSLEQLDQFIKDAVYKIKTDEMGTNPEEWSKKEGWSVQYFNTHIKPQLDKYWQIEYELVSDDEPSIGEATMYMAYNGNKRPEVTSDTTFDAIINGERTATSRHENWPGTAWWKTLNVGDVITLRDTKENLPTSRRIKVRITRAAHKLSGLSVQEVLQPLYEIDERIRMMHQEKLYKDKEDRVRTVYLPLYDDSKYLEFYLGQNNTGRKQTLSDLQFALNAKDISGQYLFSQEDRILIQDMINAINVFNEHLEQAQQNKKAPKNQNNPATFHMNSGGAHGSDLEWAAVAKEFGMLDDPNHISHYYYGEKTEGGNFPISEDDYKEGIRHVETANDVLKRKPGSYMHLLARNWKQVKESDGIFAIGNIKSGNVDGGTGWAVQMAKDAGKQVHVFDLWTERWYIWDSEKKTFVYESTPKLTKNFAGIGTRSIEPNIETLTKGKVKYVGDKKREAALNAMRDVFKNTFGEPKKQDNTVQNDAQRFNSPKEDKQVLNSKKTILSNEELAIWNEAGVGENPRILVASERTDPAFHVKQILDILDGKESVQQWGVVDGKRAVVGNVSGKDFAGLYLITKHDGLPMQKLLETKIPKLIHFSITGLGGTEYEPGVMKADDLLDRIAEYIKMGLDPNTVTIRIDPIIPGVTTPGMIRNIIKRSSEMGIKRIRFSIMDAYPNTVTSMSKLGYDFERNYGTNHKTGKPNFTAKREIIDKIVNTMIMLKNEYGVTLGTCAEGLTREGISKEGCLSVESVNRMLGTSIEDKGTANNDQRVLCSCYGGKIDALKYNAACASHCIYCYAKHENDKTLEYYNEDGTLKDNVYTRVNSEDVETNKQAEAYKENGKPVIMYRGYALTEDREANSIEETIAHTAVDYDESLKGSIYFTSDPEEAMDYAKTRTDKSDETFIDQNGQKVTQRNRHYTGDFAKVSAYNISSDAKIEHYKDMDDYVQNGKNSDADVVILDRGTMWANNIEYIVRNKNVIVKAAVKASENVEKKVSVSTTTYTSESVKNPRTAVVFTENMQAEYARRKNTPSSSTLKLNVTEGTTGTNQAVVRMSDDTTYNPNSFGLIVKKYQQDNHGRWFYDDNGNFQDTDADFTMFKEANEAMFDRLSSFDGDTIVFPASAAMGKAALPKRFVEWLAQELYERYGLFTVVKPNPKYTGKFGVYIYENTGTINVYSKAGNTNLSNFEARPYRTQVSKTYPAVDVNHVEHAFQLAKAVFANQHGDITDYELFAIQKGMQNASPEECRRIGRSLKMSAATLTEWNKVSSKMLDAQMRRSFNAHPEVTAELLRTGDAKITHNYPNGNPIDERFGPILEKIRSDIRKEQELDKNCN